MFRVLTCIAVQHDLRLVLIAGLICVVASFTTFRLYANARRRAAEERLPWLAFTALAAGCGVWATHFIAMLAYAPQIRSGYELAGTVLSLPWRRTRRSSPPPAPATVRFRPARSRCGSAARRPAWR